MKLPRIFRYLFNSGIVTVVDVMVVWILVQCQIDIVVSNTIGVIVGFLLGYMLTAWLVFDSAKGKGGFVIYFVTFLIGLILADFLIWWGNQKLFVAFSENINFLLSKGLSVVVPFFVMYFLRRYLYQLRESQKEEC